MKFITQTLPADAVDALRIKALCGHPIPIFRRWEGRPSKDGTYRTDLVVAEAKKKNKMLCEQCEREKISAPPTFEIPDDIIWKDEP